MANLSTYYLKLRFWAIGGKTFKTILTSETTWLGGGESTFSPGWGAVELEWMCRQSAIATLQGARALSHNW